MQVTQSRAAEAPEAGCDRIELDLLHNLRVAAVEIVRPEQAARSRLKSLERRGELNVKGTN